MKTVFVALAALSFSVPAVAQEAAKPATDAAPVKEKKICRREDVLGSMMGHIECHTKSQWVEMDRTRRAAAEDALERTGRNNQGFSAH